MARLLYFLVTVADIVRWKIGRYHAIHFPVRIPVVLNAWKCISGATYVGQITTYSELRDNREPKNYNLIYNLMMI